MPTNSSIVSDLDFRPLIDEYKQNGNNVWNTAYQNAMLPYEEQLASATSQFEHSSEHLKEDYGEAINKAYESYVANKRAAEFSSYGTGDVRNMIDAMGKAYDENKRSIFETYLANQESLDTKYANVVSSYYQQALSTQNLLEQEKSNLAENYTDMVYSIHGYLNKLLDNNPELFKTNPLLNQFVYFDDKTGDLSLVDEKGFIQALSETNLDTGETTLKSKGGIEDLFNLVTSLGGLNDKNTLSYESYMRDYESDLYSWLSGNSNQNLYQMYDILGFDKEGLFKQSSQAEPSAKLSGDMVEKLSVDFGDGENKITMYKYVDKSTGKTYEPVNPIISKADGRDNVEILGKSYDLERVGKADDKLTSILNYMSTGNSKSNNIPEDTIQIYDDYIYKYDDGEWIKLGDGDYKVRKIINIIDYEQKNSNKAVYIKSGNIYKAE